MSIKKFIKQFTKEKILFIKIRNQYFIADTGLIKLKDTIKQAPFSIGIYLGEDKNNRFVPSIALIDIIAKKSKKKIYINDKAEWLFLCGRVLLEESIIKNEVKLVKDEFVLIQNKSDENLGYGKVEKHDNKVMIKNMLDKGAYLRIERYSKTH